MHPERHVDERFHLPPPGDRCDLDAHSRHPTCTLRPTPPPHRPGLPTPPPPPGPPTPPHRPGPLAQPHPPDLTAAAPRDRRTYSPRCAATSANRYCGRRARPTSCLISTCSPPPRCPSWRWRGRNESCWAPTTTWASPA